MSRRTCFVCSRNTTLAHETVSALCRNCRKHPLDLISKSEAEQTYKVTDSELLGLPHLHRPNPKYKCAAPMRLYARQQVERLAASDNVQERLAKQQQRSSAEAVAAREMKRDARLRKRYPSWRDALLPACEAMFNLNRYAKHKECRSTDEIYDLKNGLIELLYLQGACVECLAHERTLPAQECRRCEGSGQDEHRDEKGDWFDILCDRCGGTGNWREERVLRDIGFKFMVCGRVFAWHQPDGLVGFNYEVSAVEQGVPTVEKPVEMSAAKMRKGKHIIRYVLDNAPRLCREAA